MHTPTVVGTLPLATPPIACRRWRAAHLPAPRPQVETMATEILVALKKLGEPLTSKEEAFLAQNKSASLSEFEAIDDSLDTIANLPEAT